jgi:hypothetical protein
MHRVILQDTFTRLADIENICHAQHIDLLGLHFDYMVSPVEMTVGSVSSFIESDCANNEKQAWGEAARLMTASLHPGELVNIHACIPLGQFRMILEFRGSMAAILIDGVEVDDESVSMWKHIV